MLITTIAAIIAASATGGALIGAYYAGKRSGFNQGEDIGYDKGYTEASKFARQSTSLTSGQQPTKSQGDPLTDLLVLFFSLFLFSPPSFGKTFPVKNSSGISEKDTPEATE